MANKRPRKGVTYQGVTLNNLVGATTSALLIFRNIKDDKDAYIVTNVVVTKMKGRTVTFFCTDESAQKAYKGIFTIATGVTIFMPLEQWDDRN